VDDTFKETLEIVRAQAGHRVMTAEEIVSMIISLDGTLAGIMSGTLKTEIATPVANPKKSIKENSITCLECAQVMKIITKSHLARHGLSHDEYREKYGLKKGTALAAKSLVKARREKMSEMKLWERRKKKVEAPAS